MILDNLAQKQSCKTHIKTEAHAQQVEQQQQQQRPFNGL